MITKVTFTKMKFATLLLCAFIFSVAVSFSQSEPKNIFVGGASYYAKMFQGRKTSNGEIFSNYEMTCAHRKLPFNTMLKVTNQKTGISTIVRVNDRGPYKKGRIIDLSEQAARIIGSYQHGVTRVKIEILEPAIFPFNSDSLVVNGIFDLSGTVISRKAYCISIFHTQDFQHAYLLAGLLSEQEYIQPVYIGKKRNKKGDHYHLLIANIETKAEALKLKDFWERKGFMNVNVFEKF